MPPCPGNTRRFNILLLVMRALGRGLVERVLEPDIGFDFSLRGFKADLPSDLACPIDLNLRHT